MENAKTTSRPRRAATAKGTYAPALVDAVAATLKAAGEPDQRTEPVPVELPQLESLQRSWTLRQLARPDRWQLTFAAAGRKPSTFTWTRDIDAAAARMAHVDRAAQDAAGGSDA